MWKFFSIIKGLEIVGQIVIYNYQNQINAWKKSSDVEHDVCSNLLKMYEVFCLKELSGAITWNLLSGGNFLEGNYPRVIIQRTIIQAPISRAAILLEAIVLGATNGRQLTLEDNCSRGNFPGGNCPGAFIRGVIIQGAIVRGVIIRVAIVLEPVLVSKKNKFIK